MAVHAASGFDHLRSQHDQLHGPDDGVDLAPLDILVREAGGAFISLDGTAGPHGGSAVATNGVLHDRVLGTLSPG